MKLTEHFSAQEIFGRREPDRLELFLARQLCLRLEVLRNIAKSPLRVTDGARPIRVHHHLVGPWFFGMGAGDVLPIERGQVRPWTKTEYQMARRTLVDGPARPLVGQLIFYPKRGHIHISNPRHVLFNAQAIRGLGLPVKRPAYIYPE